jgi:predicted  nucleic acid-binding Zn-ribbon protein
MTLLSNEVEAIHKAKKAINAIRDDVTYAEVESAIEDLIKVIGRVQARLIESNKRIKQLEQELSECNSHCIRLIESSMEAWGRIEDQEGSR